MSPSKTVSIEYRGGEFNNSSVKRIMNLLRTIALELECVFLADCSSMVVALQSLPGGTRANQIDYLSLLFPITARRNTRIFEYKSSLSA